MAVATAATELNISPDCMHEGELEYEDDFEGTAVAVCSTRKKVPASSKVVESSEYVEDFEGEGENTEDQQASYDDDSFEVDKDLSADQPIEANSVCAHPFQCYKIRQPLICLAHPWLTAQKKPCMHNP